MDLNFTRILLAIILVSGSALGFCGDSVCDSDEEMTCPQDCNPLRVDNIITNPEKVISGERFDLHLWVINTGKETFEGDLKMLVYLEDELLGIREQRVELRPGAQNKVVANGLEAKPPPGNYKISIRFEYIISGKRHNNIFDFGLNILEPRGNFLEGREDDFRADEVRQLLEQPGFAKSDEELNALYSIGLLVTAALAGLFVVLYSQKIRAKKPMPHPAASSELSELYRKKEELEEMIKIAKVKFYKRALDEESYKEIVKENQGRLIEIEAKIGEIEKRVRILEEIQSKKGKK
jgi:hypothetical protein